MWRILYKHPERSKKLGVDFILLRNTYFTSRESAEEGVERRIQGPGYEGCEFKVVFILDDSPFKKTP